MRELAEAPSAPEAFGRIAEDAHPFFLDSGIRMSRIGRYSFLGCEPFQVLTVRGRRVEIQTDDGVAVEYANPFEVLRREIGRFQVEEHPEIPFPCGAVGFLGYDLGAHVERLPCTTVDDIGFPDAYFGFYDRVVAYDHLDGKVWLAAAELPGLPGAAEDKLECLARKLHAPAPKVDGGRAGTGRVDGNFTRDEYLAAVQRAKDYIAAGDIFQVNLSQRFQTRLDVPAHQLYRRLRAINPAPYAAYLGFGDCAIVSASPELFLRVRGRSVETRPIKGTRPRGSSEAEDSHLREALLHSEKDAAELTMIVDLERNDLGRVCSYGTVRVSEPRTLEAYPTVWHGVATVAGELHEGHDRVDLLKATFPGGSVTGAPKIRAMEIIDELEPTRRSAYTGAIGCLGFDGGMNLNIVIRTFLVNGRDAFFQVGGGIVADSELVAEYDETLDKARALIESVGGRVESRRPAAEAIR